MAFILSSLERIVLFWRIWGYISGLFGLKVVTYGIKLLPLLVDSFCLSKSDLFRALIFNFCYTVINERRAIFLLQKKRFSNALQAVQGVCGFLKLSFLILLLNYRERFHII